MSYPEGSANNTTNENFYPGVFSNPNPDRLNTIPGVYIQPGQNINAQNTQNYSRPLLRNPNPIYPIRTIPLIFPQPQPFYNNQPYPDEPSSPPIVHRPNNGCFLVYLLVQLSLMIVTLNINWFVYCYWDFSLLNREGSPKNSNYNSGSIKSLYDDACDSDRDKYSNCPDLCDSLKNVRYSGLMGLGITACVLSGISILLGLFKVKFRSSRFLNWIIYLSTFASALIYTIGFIVYKSESKFDDNFHDVKKSKDYNGDDPDDFSWDGGYPISIAAMCISWISIFLSKLFTSRMERLERTEGMESS